MHEAHDGCRAVLKQVDRDRGGAGWQGRVAVPAPREHDAAVGDKFDERPARLHAVGHRHSEYATRHRIDGGGGTLPACPLRRVGQVFVDGLRGRRDPTLYPYLGAPAARRHREFGSNSIDRQSVERGGPHQFERSREGSESLAIGEVQAAVALVPDMHKACAAQHAEVL